MFEDVVEFESVDKEDRPLKFYYNREERIKKASPQVQEYYRGGMRPVKGFRVLFTGGNKYIFFALIFFVAATWIYTGLNKTRQYAKISDINMELSAFVYEEEVYVNLSMKKAKSSKKRGFSNLIPERKKSLNSSEKVSQKDSFLEQKKVDVEFFFIEVNNGLFEKKSFSEVFDGKDKSIRTKITDYDIIRVDAIVNVDGEEKELSCGVKR